MLQGSVTVSSPAKNIAGVEGLENLGIREPIYVARQQTAERAIKLRDLVDYCHNAFRIEEDHGVCQCSPQIRRKRCQSFPVQDGALFDGRSDRNIRIKETHAKMAREAVENCFRTRPGSNGWSSP